MTKRCWRCKETKPHDAFNKNRARKDGLNTTCRQCQSEEYREYIDRHKETARERAKNRAVTYRRGWRAKAIELYGGRCTCCGEDNLAFLCIDHIHGGGRKARRENSYVEMRQAVLTPDHSKYQVLCANCNMAKERAEGCPHKQDVIRTLKES